MTEERAAAATHARTYRDRRLAAGYAPLNLWVPRDMRADLAELIHAEVERRLALLVEPQRRRI
jgi:hypothetical protein